FFFSFFKYPSVGTSKRVLTNSIPLRPKSSRAMRGKSRFFHFPALISSTSAHCAREISSFEICEVVITFVLWIKEGAIIPAAPMTAEFSKNFRLCICRLFFRLKYDNQKVKMQNSKFKILSTLNSQLTILNY